MNITCALSPRQIESLYANVYGHLSKNKSFDPETYMRNLFNKIAEKTNPDNAAKFLQYVPDIMYKASAQLGLDNLPEGFDFNRIRDLNKIFKDPERGLLNIIDVFKKDDTPLLRQLAELEKELALKQEQIETEEPPVKNPDRYLASQTFTGTGSPFVKINPNDKKTLEPTTLDKSKKSFINTFDKLEKAFQISENPDLFEYQGVQVKIKAQILSEFVRTNNISLLYTDTQNEYNRSIDIVTEGKQKEDVFQNNQRVILVLVDEAGENLYFDQDGNITTKENGQIFYQFLRAARKTNSGFTVKDIYNIEDQVKDSKDKQKEFETLYNIQESLKSDPDAVQFLPFIGVTSGVNSDLSSIVIGIKDLIEQPTVNKNVVNTLDIAGEFDEQIRNGFAYIVLNNNKFEITRPQITETIASEIAELLMNPNIPVDTKIKVLEGYSSRTLTSKVKKHKYTNDGVFMIYAKTGLEGVRQDIKFTSEAISKMSDDEILNNITAIKNAYLKGYNGKPTFFTYEKDFINKTKPFLRYDVNTKQIKVDNNYVDFITQFNQDVRLINGDPGFYNKQIVFGAPDGPISLLQDSQTETIDENLNSVPGTVNEIKEVHAALVERLKKGENITGDIIFPEGSITRFSFVESNGKIADAYNTAENKDIVIINEENFGSEIDALRNSNNYLGVTAELKYRDKVDEFDDVIEVYIGDKYVGNIRVSTDEEFEAQKKKDLSVENPSFQSQQINNNDLNTPQTSLDLDFDRSNYPDDKPTKEMISAAEKWWKTSKTGKIFRENNIGFSFAMNLVNSNVYAKFVTSGSNLLNPDDPFIASILINPAKGTFVDLYHESWHVFSQLFLTKAEKFALYDEVAKESKNPRWQPGSGLTKDQIYFEIEETLAEDFRSYAKNQSVKKDSPKRNSLFRRILKFLKALFGIKNPSAHEVKMDIMNVPRVAELYNNLYIGNINNYEPTINNIYFFDLDRGVSNVNYPKYEALSTGDSQQLSRSIDNLIVEEIKAIYDERKDAGLPNLKATALGMLLLEKYRAYLYNRIKQRLQDKLDEETTKLGVIKGVPLLSTFKTKQDFKDHAVAIMNNTKGRDKYVLLKSQIDNYNLLDADLKNGDRVKGEKWHSIKIVGDFYTHKELKDVDIIVVSKYEDAEIQLKNYIEGGAEAYDKIIPVNPTFSDQVLTPEQEVLSDNIRILQTAISNWGNDSKGVIQYHMNNSDFEILKKSVEVDIEDDIDSDDNVKDPNNPAETHRDSSNLADEKNLKTKLQDLLGSETKFILKSLTKVDFENNPVKDKFGFNERADFRKVFTQVAKTIGGIQDRNEVYRLLSEEASKKDKDGNLIFPELNELIEYKLPDPKNIRNRFEAKVSLSFWQDFSRPRIKYWNLLGVPIVKEIDMGGVLEKTPVGYDFIFTQSSIEVSSIMKGWLNRYSTSPNTKYLKKTEDNKRELKLSKIVQEFSNSKGELDKTKDFEFANAIGIYFDDVTAIKDDLSQKREYYGLPYIFRILKTYEQIEQNPSNYSPLQVESAARFKQNPLTVLNSEIGAGIVDKSAVNQKTQVKRMIELQAKYGYDSANLGVLLPNNNIAYENSDMSAMLEKTNALNSAKSFADLIKNYPHMRYLDPKINTFTKRLTLLNQLFDLNNPMAERNDKTLETIYIAGFKPEGEVGQATTELDPLGRFLLGFSNVLLGGVDELPRMSEKKSSFAIRLKGGLQGGVTPTGITKGDDLYLYADLPMFREISKAREYIFETHMLNYIAAEFDRIKKFRNPKERPDLLKISGFNRPVGISQNGNEVVEGDIFSAFDTILRNSTKRDLYALADDQLEMDIVDYIRQNRDLYDKIFNDITEYFNFQAQSHIDLYYNKIPFVSKSILEKMFNRELNDNEILDLRKNTKVINRLMQAYLYNDWIHKFETSIILMGDFAQWNHFKEDWSKRIPGVQSSGYSILNDKDWQNYMKTVEMTEDKTYAGKLSKQLDRKDLNNYIFSEKIITGVIKDAQRKSVYLDDLKEAWREAYESYPSLSKEDIDNYVEEDADAYAKMDESDGIAFITFDAYRALSISGRKWSVSQEDLFQKIANGDKVTPAQVLEAFPIRKYHYFGSLENDFIATTAMHKFSVMPLIPNGNAKEGSELYKLHLKMLKDNVQYVTFESGSKGAYLTEDGQVNNLFATKEDKDLNEEAIITANPIYLNYLKEVTVINDKLKNVIPIATQTRFIIYDNLFDNGKLINEKNKPLVDTYNTNVKNLTELYKRELLDEIGFEEVDGNYVGNLKRFVEVIRDELGKRNVPYHIQKLVDTSRKGDHLRYDLSLIPEAEKIEKLILSIIQNRIVRQKTKGEPMVQAPSTFTNGLWDTPFAKDEAVAKNKELEKKFLGSNTLPFYRRGEIINKKTGERSPTYLAKVAIPFNGDFVNLLNLEWQGSKIQTMERLNELIKTDEFLNQHREALTLVGPRIPNDATNTIEAFEVWHFVDASVLNTVIVPTELVAKAGSDFDGDKLFLTMPHIDKTGKVINTGPATYEDFINEYERLKSLEAEGKLSKDDLKPKKYLEQVKKYYQNKYITSAANIIKIPENFAYLTKPNKTYLVQKYVADLEKGSNLYDRYDNPHKIASIKNSKGQKRLSPSTLLTAAYNLYKFDANLSLEPALGITAKVNKNHIMYKTLSAPMPLVYKKQVNLGNGYIDETIDVPMHMRFKVNKINIDGKDHISLSGAYTSKGPRITDVNSHNLNGILDRGKESWPFILQLFPEAIGVINYLIQVGVSEEEVFYLMNQPLVKQYIENIRKYNNAFSPVLTPGTYARFQAKQDALSNIPYTELIKVGFKANELKLKRHIEFMSGPIKVNYKNKEGEKVSDEFSNVADFKKSNLYKNELQKISSIYDLNPDSNVVFNRIDLSEKRIYSSLINSENYVEFAEAASKYIGNTITIDKLKEVKDSNDMESLKALAIFANYIELENQKTGLDNFQIISSYDTDKLSTVQQVNKRRLGLLALKEDSKIDKRFVEEVMEKSIMKNFNNTDLIIDIAESVLPFRLHPVTTAFIEITMSNSKVKRRFGEGVAGEEKFTKNYNNAILNNLFQNRLTYFYNEDGIKVTVPEEFHSTAVKINNSIENEVNITEDSIEVNLDLLTKIYENRAYLAKNFTVDKNYTALGYHTFIGGNLNPFKNLEQFVKFVMHREYIRKDKPLSSVKDNIMYKNILEESTSESAAYEKFLAESALYQSFNPAYITGTTTMSYYDLVMRTIIDNKILTNTFPVLNFITQATLKNPTLKLFDFSDGLSADGDMADSYKNQLDQLGDIDFSKYAGNEYKELNKHISNVFKYFSEAVYFQHGVGKNRFGYANILNAEKFTDLIKQPVLNFQKNVLSAEDPFEELNSILQILLSLNEFKNYTETPVVQTEVEEEDEEGSTIVFPSVKPIPSVKSTQPTQPSISRGFQGYKGGFEDKGKGTSEGDGKDKAMREVATASIVEIKSDKKASSSMTTLETVGTDNDYSYEKDRYVGSSYNGSLPAFSGIGIMNNFGTTVMLARNGELKNLSLSDEAKRLINLANQQGASFVVGDMPGVDSQFIDYLQEIGAKFTIYHTGSTPRIQITQPSVVQGVEIGSNAKGLAAALTNPTELAKSKGNLTQSYPIEFNGKTYKDVEAAYQALKDKSESTTKPTKENSKNYKLMVDLITAKLQQHPRLVSEITKQGGSAWILSSTHQPTKANTVWETGGQNWFIESLNDAYLSTQPTEGSDQYYQLKNIYNSATELETKLKSFNKTARAIGSNKKIDELLKKLNIESQVRNQFIQLLEDNPELKDLKLSDVMSSYLKEFIKDSDKQYYTAIQEELDSELEDTLIDYFSRFNIRRQELDNLKEKFGVDTVGVFDVLAKTIYYSKNRNLLTLPEEYGHVFVELLGSVSKKGADNPLFNYLINNIENWDGYNRVFNDYKDVYVTDEGNIDIYKIKKEAIGQAIGIALVRNYKVQKGDKGFWSKIQQVIDYILNLIGGINYVSLNTTVDSIAKDILSKNYLKLDRLNKDTSNYNLLSYSETIKLQNQKDNGRALNFMKWFSNKGMIITGSLAYRLQGTVYRPAIDALHDIDNIVPSDVHGMNLLKENFLSPEELANDKLYRKLISEGNYKEANKYKLKGGNIRLNVDDIYNTVPILQEFQKEFPDTDFLYSFYNQKANAYYVTINAIWSEDQSLKDRFKAYSGSFNQRLLNFTEEELDKIYLFDFFLRPETSEEYVKIDDPEFGLTLAHFNYSFYEKLNMMGRAKDAYDYQMWDYFNDDNILAPDFNDRLVYFQINRNSLDTTLKAQPDTNLNLFGLEGFNIPDTGDTC